MVVSSQVNQLAGARRLNMKKKTGNMLNDEGIDAKTIHQKQTEGSEKRLKLVIMNARGH